MHPSPVRVPGACAWAAWQEASRFFHIVTGPPGAGKSTLLREACRALGSRVGYLDVDPAFEVDWGRDLGNAFNFRRAPSVGCVCGGAASGWPVCE